MQIRQHSRANGKVISIVSDVGRLLWTLLESARVDVSQIGTHLAL